MARIIDLHNGQMLQLDAAPGAQVRVLFGAVWLTEPGRLDDIFAASGDEIVLDRGRRVLIEAQSFARVIVPAARPQPMLADALARLRATFRRWVPVPAFAAT